MKTTIDVPDGLLHEAKVMAAQRRTTLKDLVVEGLKHVIHGTSHSQIPSKIPASDLGFFENDSYGVPVLKRRGAKVTENWIETMREKEGI